jgi:hypothetical protein
MPQATLMPCDAARLKSAIRLNISSLTFYLRENASKGSNRSSEKNKK